MSSLKIKNINFIATPTGFAFSFESFANFLYPKLFSQRFGNLLFNVIHYVNKAVSWKTDSFVLNLNYGMKAFELQWQAN